MIDLQPAGDQDISRRDHQAQYLEFLDDEVCYWVVLATELNTILKKLEQN